MVTNYEGQKAPEEPTQSRDCSVEFERATLMACTAEVQHEIKFTDDQPVKQPCRRVPPAQLDEFREAVKDMLEAGVIRKYKSPYSSPVHSFAKWTKG